MKKWVIIIASFVLMFAIIGTWEAKRCEDSTTANSFRCLVLTPANLPNIFLVLIGFGGIVVAIGTLDVLERQTEAARIAAESAKDSAEALWAGQRAQLSVAAYGSPIDDIVSKTPRVQIELANRGMTPAYDCSYDTWIEILPKDCKDFTELAEYFVEPGHSVIFQGRTIVISIALSRLPDEHLNAIRRGEKTAFVRIRVEYSDSKESGRFIDFGFRVDFQGLSPIAKYNGAN